MQPYQCIILQYFLFPVIYSAITTVSSDQLITGSLELMDQLGVGKGVAPTKESKGSNQRDEWGPSQTFDEESIIV